MDQNEIYVREQKIESILPYFMESITHIVIYNK